MSVIERIPCHKSKRELIDGAQFFRKAKNAGLNYRRSKDAVYEVKRKVHFTYDRIVDDEMNNEKNTKRKVLELKVH